MPTTELTEDEIRDLKIVEGNLDAIERHYRENLLSKEEEVDKLRRSLANTRQEVDRLARAESSAVVAAKEAGERIAFLESSLVSAKSDRSESHALDRKELFGETHSISILSRYSLCLPVSTCYSLCLLSLNLLLSLFACLNLLLSLFTRLN